MKNVGVVALLLLSLACASVIQWTDLPEATVDCPTAPQSPGDRRTSKTSLRVVAWNVEWAFMGQNSYNCPGTGCPWKTEADAQQHLQTIASVLVTLNADIISFEEVQDCNVLKQINSYIASISKTTSPYLPYMVAGTDTATGQNVGILTKIDPKINMLRTEERVAYPIPGSQCYSAAKNQAPTASTSAVSKHYYTVFNISGLTQPLLLVGLHFLAYPTDPARCSQREAQATVIQHIEENNGTFKGYHIITLGDFNDYDADLADPAGDKPISQVMSLVKKPLAQNLQSTLLTNSGSLVKTTADRYSDWYDKNSNCIDDGANEHTLIDHVVVSKDLAAKISAVNMYHGFTASCSGYYSDHWPIVVDFKL